MNNNQKINTSRIITSTVDIPNNNNGLVNQLKRFNGLPLREIELELDSIDLAEEFLSNDYPMLTALINYPLGGYQSGYIMDLIQWAGKKKIDIICSSLPLFWLKSNKTIQLKNLMSKMIDACQEKILRISFESELFSKDETSIICELICEAGISNIKSSSGFSHSTSIDNVIFIKENFPDLLLTVDNNLRGDSHEIDDLLQTGVHYVCVKEPWLYHF